MSRSDVDDLKPVLDQFFKESATPGFSEAIVLPKLKCVVHRILETVQEIDKRICGEIVDVGSNESGTAAIISCEFDILLRLKIAGYVEEYKSSPGFAKYRLADSSAILWADANVNGYLQPNKVTGIFQKRVREAVSSLESELKYEISVGGEGTAATTITSNMRTFGKYKADVVLAVRCEGWPSSSNAPWLQPGYSREWPKRKTIDVIKKNGYELVSKYVNEFTPGVTVEEMDFLWSISMSRSETLLLGDIDDGGLCHKKLLVILKAIVIYYRFSSRSRPPSYEQTSMVSSYHMKTMLFWESHAYPQTEQWSDDKLPERFRSFVVNYDRNMGAQNLPNFFIPGVNLYKGYSGFRQLFEKLCTDPVQYIQSMKQSQWLRLGTYGSF